MRAAADVGRGHAVPDAVTRALREAHDGRSVHAASDGAADGEVLDGGAVDVAEQGGALVVGVGNVSGDGVAVAQERALERIGLACARHRRDADVFRQLHVLPAVVVDVKGEGVPLIDTTDEVWGLLRTAAAEGGRKHVVRVVVADTVIIGLHPNAVVLLEGAEVERDSTCDDAQRAIGAGAGGLVTVSHVDSSFVQPHKVEIRGVLSVGHHVEAVGDVLRAIAFAPSDDGSLGHSAVRHRAAEDAAADGDVAGGAVAQDAADVRAAADVGRGHAALNHVARAFRDTHDGRSVDAAADGACHLQVLDGGPVDVAEQGGALVAGVGNVSGDGVAVAVERALEPVGLAAAHHRQYADVDSQLHVLAAVVAPAADVVGKAVPVFFAVDDVGGVRRAAALRGPVGQRAGGDGDVPRWHDERQRAVDVAAIADRVAVGILDVDSIHFPLSRLGERHRLAMAGAGNALLTTGTDHVGGATLSGEADAVGILVGIAIRVVTSSIGILVMDRVVRVVHIFFRTV